MMQRRLPVLFAGLLSTALVSTSGQAAEPKWVKIMEGLEASIDTIGGLDGGVRLTVPLKLRNTGKQFIAIALVPAFAKASGSDGTTYFMQDVGGVMRLPQ
jgi:hypothetical protein